MATNYLNRTPGTPTSEKIFTMSCWVKVNDIGGSIGLFAEHQSGGAGSNGIMFFINATSKLEFYATNGGSEAARFVTNRSLRDCGGWMHLVCQIDTTNSTATDRVKFWVNGTRETSLSTESAPGININLNGRDGTGTQLFGTLDNSSYDCKADIAHAHFVDGSLVAPTVFGETDSTSGIWKPITDPSGITYGTNGYWLKFENASNMGVDSKPSGASNFTVNGTIRQHKDTPTNNFCTLNAASAEASQFTLADGNLSATYSSSDWETIEGTTGITKGKWYYETKWNGSGSYMAGWITSNFMSMSPTNYVGHGLSEPAYALQAGDGGVYYSTSSANSQDSASWGDTFGSSNVLGCAIDIDNGKIYWSKDGTWMNSGDPTSGSTGTGAFSISDTATNYFWQPVMSSYNGAKGMFNFGGGYFGSTEVSTNSGNGYQDANGHGKMTYTVPTGYYTLNTKNIKEFG